jgi:hypothetical protein
MRILTPLLVALSGLLCGCAHEHFTKGRGDVGQFIVIQAVVRCGLPTPTNHLPVVTGRWRYSKDEQGVVIQMPREQYPAIETLLRQTFGAPRFGPVDTKDGGKLGGYRLTPKGGGIQFGYDAERTQVIVIRPLSKQEFGEGFQKAMQDDRFWENLAK